MKQLKAVFSDHRLTVSHVRIWASSRESLIYWPNQGRNPRPGSLSYYREGTFMGGYPWDGKGPNQTAVGRIKAWIKQSQVSVELGEYMVELLVCPGELLPYVVAIEAVHRPVI